jgi:ubiquitin-like 1-activating enzyme E1 A
MKALANEIAKNLVLAGIGSLTIMDHETVTPSDLGAQFFLSDDCIGRNRAEAAAPQICKLNPRVKIIVDTDDIKLKGASYFAVYDIIIATDLRPDSLNIINTATRVNHKPFYAAGVHGFYGFIFSDLIQHDFVIERQKSNRDTVMGPESRTRAVVDVKTKRENGKEIELVTKRELYSTWFLASDDAALPAEIRRSARRLRAVTPILSCLRALWAFQELYGHLPSHNSQDLANFTNLATMKHRQLGLPTETLRADMLRSFMQNVGSEIAPVTAMLGGQLAQDVINVLGQRQQPIQNFVFFDGDSMDAPMIALHPDGALGEGLLPFSASAGVVGTGGMMNGGMDFNGMPNGNSVPNMSDVISL